MELPIKSIYKLRQNARYVHGWRTSAAPQCLNTRLRLESALLRWAPVCQSDSNRTREFRVFHEVRIKEVYQRSVSIKAFVAPEVADALAESDLQWSIEDLLRELRAYLEVRRPLTVEFTISIAIAPGGQ